MSGSKLISFLGRPVVVATIAVAMAAALIIAVGVDSRHRGSFTPASSTTPLPVGSPSPSLSPSPSPGISASASASASLTPPPVTQSPAPETPITWVQANVKDGMAAGPTSSDVGTVFSEAPDFISFNEVEWRSDAVLDRYPEQYGIWRTPGQYTGETPILWNATKWTEVAEGTTMLSHVTTIPKGKKTEWGMRYANWVTVVNAAGQKVSAISAHLAPANPAYGNLIPRELTRLGALVAQLRADGPVLVGGDFNTNYDTTAYPAYPRTQLTELDLTPTYDIFGQRMPTGDEYGASIDYLFLDDPSDFALTDQHVDELKSDHKALVTRLQLVSSGWGTRGHVFAPGARTGNKVRSDALAAIRNARSGSTLAVATSSLSGSAVLHALEDAYQRGVSVQVVVGDRTLTANESALRKVLHSNVHNPSFIRREHRAFVGPGRLPQSEVLAARSGATSFVRLRFDRPFTSRGLADGPTGHLTTSEPAYTAFLHAVQNAVGRTV